VGINLAIQDAVAAAQRIAQPLLRGTLDEADLAAVQKRRWFPTVVIQKVQLLIQKAVFGPAVRGQLAGPPSRLVFIAQHMPWLGKLPALMIAFGPRPEHAPDFARRKAPKTRNPA
jgi:2-polyprenyl-6-methoxyphenol hydroxylase-like FAD-dependent oxidoreductase